MIMKSFWKRIFRATQDGLVRSDMTVESILGTEHSISFLDGYSSETEPVAIQGWGNGTRGNSVMVQPGADFVDGILMRSY